MDGRHSLHDNRLSQSDNPNVFDDEYAVDTPVEDEGIPMANGFRPTQDQTTAAPARSSLAAPKAAAAATNSEGIVSRNSISKAPLPRHSLTIANEGSSVPLPSRTQSIYADSIHRADTPSAPMRSPSRASSFAPTMRSQSPFVGANGPSHPYGMYPQGTGLGRTASVATTNYSRDASRPLSGSQRPAHPYAMYPQNVYSDVDESAQPAESIPVGFPGLNNGFVRRIGADGEEQDIIGPDGHTEQLPPYSRYPEEGGVVKEMNAASVPVATAQSDPTASSDTLVPASNVSTSQRTSLTRSAVDSEPVSEKRWRDKTWKEQRKTKFCFGKIPLIWIIVVGVFLILMGAVVGGLVGGFTAHAHAKQANALSQLAASSLFDVSIIRPSPTGIPPLPTGTYAMLLGVPEEQQHGCLRDGDELDAWGCNLIGPPPGIAVNNPPEMPFTGAKLVPAEPPDGVNFGMQIPIIDWQPMQLAKDLDDQPRGPAYHFQTLYDKIVVINGSDFNPSSQDGIQRRGGGGGGGGGGFKPSRHGVAQPGDVPWYCYWNQTFIEGFIYMMQDSSAAASWAASISQASATQSPGSTITAAAAPTSNQAAAATSSTPPNDSSGNTNSPASWVSGSATSTTVYLQPSSTSPSFSENRDFKRDEISDIHKIPPYPKVIKVEERRVPHSEPAYCRQMQVDPDGTIRPRMGSDGQPIQVQLSERDPSWQDFENAAADDQGGHSKVKRDDPSNSCHCQWVAS